MALIDKFQRKIDYLRISITDHCNRLRMTADGKLRSCLFSDNEMDIKALLRQGSSKKELVGFFFSAVRNKPRRHHLNVHYCSQNARGMYAIGG